MRRLSEAELAVLNVESACVSYKFYYGYETGF